MDTTAKVILYAIVCLAASVIFLVVSSKRQERDKLMTVQNVFNMPLMLAILSILLTDGGDPQLGLWGLMTIAIALPTILIYLITGFILPVVNLIKSKEKPRPRIYWINVAVLIIEVIALPFALI